MALTLPPRYEPVSRLGQGGGGEVWAARDVLTDEVVAFKALAEGADEREMLALVREAVALSGVEGLGVPKVLRFGRLPRSGRAYLVRELVEGESLAELVLGDDALPEHLLGAVAQAADQLTLLHRALLLHGDLKPANIIVSAEGRATLVDLGLAAAWREGGSRVEGLTPRYAAPELLEGGALTVRAEVYSLGATLGEVVTSLEDRLDADRLAELTAVVRRAQAESPNKRFPSADELASALRHAARLPARQTVSASAVWPIVGLDAASSNLKDQMSTLRPGGGIVLTGPVGSGRSALLRRIAWSLGVEGTHVAWLDSEGTASEERVLELELEGIDDPSSSAVLVDDAERLDGDVLDRLNALRERGAKLLLVTGVEGPAKRLPGRTFEVFAMTPLAEELARDLVRRAIPSLSDSVVAHVVRRGRGWPGRIRNIVAQLEGRPIVAPQDVDAIVGASPTTMPPSSGRPSLSAISTLLDRGHFEEAAEQLTHYSGERSGELAIARARLLTNRGEAKAALAELAFVRDEIDTSGDKRLAALLNLHEARAHLRAGAYSEAERAAHAVEALADAADDRAVHLVVAEALAVGGLAHSFASRHEKARESLTRAVTMARELGQPRLLSVALSSLAFGLQRDDRLSEAKDAYEEALVAAEEAGDAGTLATTRLNLAGIAKSQGDLEASLRHLEASVDMGRRSGRIATLRQALLNLANLDLYLGRIAKAEESISGLATERSALPPQLGAQLLALEAEAAAKQAKHELAERLCEQCAHAYLQIGRAVDAAEAQLEGVIVATEREDVDLVTLANRLDGVAALLGADGPHQALLALARGRVLSRQNAMDAALQAFDEAIRLARQGGHRDLLWRALDMRAGLEAGMGDEAAAKTHRQEALSIIEEIGAQLPNDLREVYWNDPRRRGVRRKSFGGAARMDSWTDGETVAAPQIGEDRLARVLEINRQIAGTTDLARLLERVTDHAIALLSAERGFVILKSTKEEKQGELSVHAARDTSGENADPHARFSQSITDRVIKSGEPIVTSSARDDTRMADYVSVHQLMLQSVACVPIRSRSGELIGALYLETRLRPGRSFARELPTLVAFADQVAIAIETARLVGENERRAEELTTANEELEAARAKLEELLGHRTEQLQATRRDLRTARAALRSHFGYKGLVGRSDAMRKVYALIDRVKETDVPVLITGESGTGKEIVARALHSAGPRSKKAFLGLNCGAIPEHLLESELFGHVRGAFTGADRDRKGLFREATDGTLLLDEIGEMPQKMQAGLLRVLQEKVVRPVGGTKEEPVDTRVIAATHRDLASMVADGSFREDLFYRLNVIPLRVPPLRERLDDVPVLIDHFLGIFAARYSRERRSVSRDAIKRLTAYHWPGNVRQLENVLLNAWVLSDGPELVPDDFELPDTAHRPAPAPSRAPAKSDAESSLASHKSNERQRILEALSEANWNRVKAAQICGLPRRTFYRRLKEYGIQ